MKKQLLLATTIVAAAAMFASCGGDMKGYKKTADGLYYKFEQRNKSAQQVQEGDVLVGEMTISLDDIQLRSNVGAPQRLMPAVKEYDGVLHEGLLMMHLGEKATFAIEADSMAKYLDMNQMPAQYVPGKGMKFYYEIDLQDIVTRDEYAEEQVNFEKEMEGFRLSEPQRIADYVAQQGITQQPNVDGLYIIVKKKGNGPSVKVGRQVSLNYTGRLLDGTIFDSSDPQAWEQAHEPLNYIVGQTSLIPGWEQGVMDQNEGTSLRLIIPSALAYGPMGVPQNGDYLIPPYSPLVFDIDILSVK